MVEDPALQIPRSRPQAALAKEVARFPASPLLMELETAPKTGRQGNNDMTVKKVDRLLSVENAANWQQSCCITDASLSSLNARMQLLTAESFQYGFPLCFTACSQYFEKPEQSNNTSNSQYMEWSFTDVPYQQLRRSRRRVP